MNTQQLKYFLSAARNLSFSDTAKEFYMTQPAISHQISDLENELGTILFKRTAKGVSLTETGRLFLEDATKLIDLQAQAKDRLQHLSSADSHKLSISYLASPCKHFLPDVICSFRKHYPQVDLNLIRLDAVGAQASIEQEEYDIYFSLLIDMTNKTHYQCRKIHEDHYCLVCRNDHPCLSNLVIDYQNVAKEPFVIFEPDKAAYMTRQIYQICKDLNFTPRVVHTYRSMEEVLFAVESGLGITILPYKIKDYVKANLSYVQLDSNNTSCAIGTAWRNREDNPAIGWFMSVLNQHLLQ